MTSPRKKFGPKGLITKGRPERPPSVAPARLWYNDFWVFGVAAMRRGCLPGLLW